MKKNILIAFGLSLVFSLSQCKRENDLPQPEQSSEVADLKKTKAVDAAAGLGGPVMMQAFYWDVPAGGTWWNVVKGKVAAWNTAGFSSIWLPPASKAQNGAFSMGYDPFDYYDFGQYNQMGSTETRFGSNTELTSLITTAHNNGLEVYADMVINHNSGGASEFNPFTNSNTWTKFTPLSGKFSRSYYDFHPNDAHAKDEGAFGDFPDLCHSKQWVKDWLYLRTDAVGKYYKNTMKYDGWRFDYVKGFGAWVVRDYVNAVGGFAVGELWDSNVDVLKGWVDGTNRTSSAFDFACYYKMDEAFDGNNMYKLNDDMLWKRDPYKAVTFVANHDTDIIYDKYLAYAYILTAEGYPCVFYRDYEEWLSKTRLNNLIWIRRNLVSGSTTNLYTDNDEYIARRNGNPGIIVYLNDSDTWQEKWITSNWASTQIKDYTGSSTWVPTTEADKRVKIQAPPHSYTVWSKVGY
ncbi:alpha-amylase [Solitalea sp. MAHUQ-68]|uniref:Alpha-amylase n=1 Tax=Solitalea agri TaxID=2953739 RepID=A0A9X2F2P0_9SPHI|nr:alpha-amylase [Solitalea agri]MCO4293517.1 alpha-amylase [Solitalea agri]